MPNKKPGKFHAPELSAARPEFRLPELCQDAVPPPEPLGESCGKHEKQRGVIMTKTMRSLAAGLAALLLSAAAGVAQPAYPTHAVKLVVPFPPGPADTLGRLYGQKLSGLLGQPFIIENRPGATGTVGAAVVAHAAPDGYTLLSSVDLPIVKAPNLVKIGYDPVKDLQPIAIVGEDSNILAAYPGAGFKTVADLVAAAKAKPSTINYASAGNGSPGHLCGEMIAGAAGIKLNHVPYSGAGPSMTAVLSGETQIFCGPVLALMPNIKAGKLVALAVTGAKPLPQLPDAKPLAASWPGLTITNWYGFFAPPRTPSALVAKLRDAVHKAADDVTIRDRLAAAGIDPIWIVGADATKRVEADLAKWAGVIKAAGIKAEQ